MQIHLTTETPEDELAKRLIEARALELGVTVSDLYRPWTIDQAAAAAQHQPQTEAIVQAAEDRAQAAVDERARLEAEKLATAQVAEPIL